MARLALATAVCLCAAASSRGLGGRSIGPSDLVGRAGARELFEGGDPAFELLRLRLRLLALGPGDSELVLERLLLERSSGELLLGRLQFVLDIALLVAQLAVGPTLVVDRQLQTALSSSMRSRHVTSCCSRSSLNSARALSSPDSVAPLILR